MSQGSDPFVSRSIPNFLMLTDFALIHPLPFSTEDNYIEGKKVTAPKTGMPGKKITMLEEAL